MKIYEYEGFDKANRKTSNGTVTAPSGEDAILILLQSGIYPTSLQELSSGQARSQIHLSNLKKFRERLTAPPSLPAPEQPKPEPWKGWSFLMFLGSVVGVAALIFILMKLMVRI